MRSLSSFCTILRVGLVISLLPWQTEALVERQAAASGARPGFGDILNGARNASKHHATQNCRQLLHLGSSMSQICR